MSRARITRFSFEPYPHRLSATFAGVTIADSDAAMVFRETRLAPAYYFPREHVRMDLMRRTERLTHCPFKGNASYWTLEVNGRSAENVMWSYEEPLDEAGDIKGYVAFYVEMLDEWFEDGRTPENVVVEEEIPFTNPLLPWLLNDAPLAEDAVALVDSLTTRMLEIGIPLWRFNLIVRTLHPQLLAVAFQWWRKSGETKESFVPYAVMQDPEFLNSPLVPIIEGAGGIRRRLDGPNPILDYPILKDLHNEGVTDYVAMPMVFSDGQINVVTMASAAPGGFSTNHLGQVYEILPVLGRLFEVHAMRYRAKTLLDTYLGQHAGQRVLEGRIKRGDGESINAIIWFCDLRESTPLAQSMPRAEFLGLLNRYFDCMAGSVLDNGGHVLRFIGDAALAIFPIDGPGKPEEEAKSKAITAAAMAQEQMAVINDERRKDGKAPLGFGIALHQGEVTYGNIGTENRLEFTVIGDAANRAARIEAMCKVLNRPVLVSESIVCAAPSRFEDLGHHPLRGVEQPLKLYALRDPEPAAA